MRRPDRYLLSFLALNALVTFRSWSGAGFPSDNIGKAWRRSGFQTKGRLRLRSSAASLLRRHVARGDICPATKKVPLHLFGEIFAGSGIREAQAVLVDQHRLMLEPLRPRFLGNALVDAFAELAGIRRKIETFGLAPELDALDHARHRVSSQSEKKIKLSHA